MNERIGKRVELLIFDKGFPSIRRFAEYLREKDPENCVSEDTISNLIKGGGCNYNTLVSIAKGLEVPVDCLTAEVQRLENFYLFHEVAHAKEEIEPEKGADKEDKINNLETYKRLHDIDKRFYPGDAGDLYTYGFKITTIAELSIYFPLLRMDGVMDVIDRIGGQIIEYEEYILGQYAHLYKTIPDIPAKKYADFLAAKFRLSNKKNLNHSEEQLQRLMEEYAESDLYNEGFLQYKAIIKREKKLQSGIMLQAICVDELPQNL